MYANLSIYTCSSNPNSPHNTRSDCVVDLAMRVHRTGGGGSLGLGGRGEGWLGASVGEKGNKNRIKFERAYIHCGPRVVR